MSRYNHTRYIFFLFIIGTVISIISAKSFGQQPNILYKLGMPKPSTHLFEVEIQVESLPLEQSFDFILPVWRPGWYKIFNFASGVQNFTVFNGKEQPLNWKKVEKSKWRVETEGSSTLRVRYKIYANEFDRRTRGLNDEHGFIDGTSVFMYIEKFRNIPLTLEVQPYPSWHVTTGLDGGGKRFTAPSYDYFIDCPIEIGTQKDFTFDVDGTPHILSITGDGNWNADTLIHDFKKIVKEQKDFWDNFPYKKYVFLIHCTSKPTGATEHLNSTIIQTKPFVFQNRESYQSLLRTATHEYFHTWNVKQLRPEGIHPYDFTAENYSRELWIVEGTTVYYDGIMMVRSGLMKAEKYFEEIGKQVQSDRQRPGNSVQPVSEASFDVWVDDGSGTEQRLNAHSDFYAKGSSGSMCLDMQIRILSSNKYSLDDLMRKMYERFPLSVGGYTLNDFRSVAEELTGTDLQFFFNDYIFGAKALQWEELLSAAGIELTPKDTLNNTWIGITPYERYGIIAIRYVTADSPAEDSGLETGDELLALNGYRIRAVEFTERLNEMKTGDTLTITVFHNDKLRDLHVIAGSTPVPAYNVSKVKNPSLEQKAIYESWLKTIW